MDKIKSWFNGLSQAEYSLGFILFAALVLYAQHAWVPGFHPDGMIYAGVMANAAEGHFIVPHFSKLTYNQFFMQPAFLFALHGPIYKLIPSSFLSARLISVMWAIASIMLLGGYLRRKNNSAWWFWSALALVITPHFMKIARFPQLDVPMTFFFLVSLIAYYKAFEENKLSHWLVSGLFFGFAFLTKGPPAGALPIIMFTHLLLTGNLSRLKDWRPWVGLFSGILLFGIWPLALYLTDQFKVFTDYLHGQVYVSLGRNRERADFALHTYPLHLLKMSPHLFFLAVYSIVKLWKDRKTKTLEMLFVAWFLGIIIPFSFVRWKLSHYLIPLYPAYAALAGYALTRFSDVVQKRIHGVIKVLIVVASLALLIFPFTVNIKRDFPLHKTIEIVNKLPKPPTHWGVVNHAYGYHNFENLLGWTRDEMYETGDIKLIEKTIETKDNNKTWIFFLHPGDVGHLERKYGVEFTKMYSKLIYFKKRSLTVLVDRRILSHELTENAIFSY